MPHFVASDDVIMMMMSSGLMTHQPMRDEASDLGLHCRVIMVNTSLL